MSVFLAMINTPLNEMHTPTTNNTIYNKIIKFPPTRIGLPKINKLTNKMVVETIYRSEVHPHCPRIRASGP